MSDRRSISSRIRAFLARGNSVTSPEISEIPLKVYELSPDYPSMIQSELIRMKSLTLHDIANLEEQQRQDVGNEKLANELQLARNILVEIDRELDHRLEISRKNFKYE